MPTLRTRISRAPGLLTCTPIACMRAIVARQSSLEKPADFGDALRDGAEHDRPVRDRFVAGNADRPGPARTGSNIYDVMTRSDAVLLRAREHTLILLAGSDGDAQVIRQPVVADRPDDHALPQHRLVDRPPPGGRSRSARNCRPTAGARTPSASKPARSCAMPARLVSTSAAGARVLERGQRRGERDRVDVERLTHAIEHVRHRGCDSA